MEPPEKKDQRAKFPFITAVNSIIDGTNLSSSDPPSEVAIEMFRKIARDHPDEVLNWAKEQAPEYLTESMLSTNEQTLIDEGTVHDEKAIEDKETVKDDQQNNVIYNYYGPIYNFSNSQASIAPGGIARTSSDNVINYVKIIEPVISNIHNTIVEKPEYKEELEDLKTQLQSAESKNERLTKLNSLRDWFENHKDELKGIAKQAILEIVKVIGTVAIVG